MRAPDRNSEARWCEIKRVLARVGLDGDAVQVKGRPLRAELERLAGQYAERSQSKILTRRQLRVIIAEALGRIADARAVLGPHDIATCFAGDDLAADARAMLDRVTVQLQSANLDFEGRDGLDIVQDAAGLKLQSGGGQSRNASKAARNRYWSALARVWRGVTPANTPRQRLIDFIHINTGAHRSAVRAFLDRH